MTPFNLLQTSSCWTVMLGLSVDGMTCVGADVSAVDMSVRTHSGSLITGARDGSRKPGSVYVILLFYCFVDKAAAVNRMKST